MNTSQILTVLHKMPYFTKQNLGLAIGKEGENLNYWVKKLMKEGLIEQVKKGFFVPAAYNVRGEDYLLTIANVLRYPSYVSLEYILSKNGIIPESAFAITSITSKSSRIYKSKVGVFIYRTIKTDLFYGYNLGNPKIADSAKALFDFLYLKPFKSTEKMKRYVFEESRINWEALTPEDVVRFCTIINESKSKKMLKIVGILQKEGIA